MERFERLRRQVAPWRSTLQRVYHGARPTRSPFVLSLQEVVWLAWPIAAAMLGETAMGLVDTWLVGGLGTRALGGVGTAVVLMYLNYAVVFGLMRGVKVSTAHAVGRGAADRSVRYALAGIGMAVAAGVLVAIGARDSSWLLRLLGVDPVLRAPARDFLAARTLGAPAAFVVSALVQYRQALGDSRTPMVAGLGANGINAVVAWVLINGHLGAPALGVRGAGYATALAESLEAAVLLWQFAGTLRTSTRPEGGWLRDLQRAFGEVAELGVPTGIQFGAEALAFTLFTVVLGTLGATEVAAHQIALATIRTSFLPGIAVAEAASVLVGRALGQRRLAEADRVTRAALLVAMGFMACCGVVFAVGGGAITAVFSSDPAVIRVGTRLLGVAAVFQLLDAANIVLRGALRGAKDVRVVAVIGTVVVWTCVPTAAWILGRHYGLGAVGGWLGFVAETTIGSAACWWRWRRGAWRKNYASAEGTGREPSEGESGAVDARSTGTLAVG